MAENATINLNVNTDESQKSLRQMRKELKELQIAMDNAADPTEFKRLETEFATLRNDMRDTSAAMKYLDPGELLSGWTKMASGAVGAFGAVTGAMSLFGNESEEIQEIEKKSMVLIQTMMGLEQARQLLIDGGGKAERKTLLSSTAAWVKKTLGIGANTAATATNTAATVAQTTATGVQTVATGGATIATKLLGAAMKALPIFAIIGGITAIVYAVSALSARNREAAKAQEELNAAGQKYNQTSRDLANGVKDYKDELNKTEIDHKLAMGEMTQNEYDHAKNAAEALESLDEVRKQYAKSLVDSAGVRDKELQMEAEENLRRMDRIRRTDYKSEEDRNAAFRKEGIRHNQELQRIQNNWLARRNKDKAKYDEAFDAAESKRKRDNEEVDKEEADRKADEARKWWEDRQRALKEAGDWMQKLNEDLMGQREKLFTEAAKQWDKADEYYNKGLISLEQYWEAYDDIQTKYNDEIKKLDDKFYDDREKAERAHQQAMKEIVSADIDNKIKNAKTAEDRMVAELEAANNKRLNDQAAADQKLADAKLAAEEKLDEDLKALRKGNLADAFMESEALKAYGDALAAAEEENKAKMKVIDETYYTESAAITNDYVENQRQARQDTADATIQLMLDTADTEKELHAANVESLKNERQKELAAAGDNEEQKRLIKEKYNKLIEQEEIAHVGRMMAIGAEYTNKFAQGFQDIFSNLTEIATMEIDAQDSAWQESFDARSEGMNDQLEDAKRVWGEESEQYKFLLDQQKDMDDEKETHDKVIADARKAAENKYKKVSIGMDMAKATSDFAMASFEIWASQVGSKGLVGIPIAIALQAMLAATFGTQMAVMAKQMSMVGKMRLGGPVYGPSHESGGVDRNLEGGEFVINAQSMKVPGVAQLASTLNRTGQGGGAVVAAIPDESIERIINSVAAIPVVVSERDITGTQRRVAVIESKTTF